MQATCFQRLRAERIAVDGRELLPVLEGEAAPTAQTRAARTQLYLKTAKPETLWMCVGAGPDGTSWKRIPWGK